MLEGQFKSIIFVSAIGVDPSDFTEPLSRSTEKTYSSACTCFGSGSISLSVQLDKDVYEIGETVVITAQVNNQSNKRIRAINVNLRRTSETHQPHTIWRNVVLNVSDSKVQATGSFSWTSNHLQIPLTSISMDTPELKMSYVLQVTAVVSWAKSVYIHLPIKIIQGPKSVSLMQGNFTYASGNGCDNESDNGSGNGSGGS